LTPMNQHREHLTAQFVGGYLYAFAGRRELPSVDRELTYNERYDPTADSWTYMTPVPTGRSGCHSAIYNNKIIVFGGEGDDFRTTVFNNSQEYDPATNTWNCYTNMPNPRHGMGVVVIGTNIWLMEGGDGPAITLTPTINYLDMTLAPLTQFNCYNGTSVYIAPSSAGSSSQSTGGGPPPPPSSGGSHGSSSGGHSSSSGSSVASSSSSGSSKTNTAASSSTGSSASTGSTTGGTSTSDAKRGVTVSLAVVIAAVVAMAL